jgi:Pyruvate/2-oxoacid:ferredoxin oxidoreductase delta subunit
MHSIEISAPPRRRTIRKIPYELRRRPVRPPADAGWYRRLLMRLRDDSQFLRSTAQLTFALLCIWIGVEFYLFMQWGIGGGDGTFVPRPPGAEGFLPISALMSLTYWLETGIINTIHPASLFIFVAILTVSLLLKKAFCSWLCPIGTLSESLWMLGQKLFRRNLRFPRWLDIPLRGLKYLLLFFFVGSIAQMDVPSLAAFIQSPYNKMADVKMYLFFADLPTVAIRTLVALVVLSVVVKNFWCRFLCPYGALLGMLSWLSPVKITRRASTCIDCALCTKACPSSITVHAATRVRSDECTACFACVEACPVKDTLVMRAGARGTSIPSWVVGSLLAGLFVGITGLAMLTGHWQNSIGREEYVRRFQQLNSPLYQHFRGEVPHYGPKD